MNWMTQARRWKVGLATATLAMALAGCGEGGDPAAMGGGAAKADAPAAPQGPPPALVRLGEVKSERLQSRVEIVGQLQELRRAVVAAETSGKVLALAVDSGDAVTGGQTVLARIDPVWTRLKFEAAEAAVAAANATLEQAQRDLTYLEELAAANSAKPKEVEDARARVKSSAAMLDGAQVALEVAKERMARLEVVAPFDGYVTAKLTEAGQWLDEGSGVVEIVSRGEIDAVVDVPERIINAVKLQEPLEVVIEPLRLETRGQVTAINPMGSKAARTYPVKIRLADQEGRLKPGMSVVARVPTGEEAAVLTVPRDAVAYTPLGATVWAEANGKAQSINVRVLFGQDDRYAVQPGPDAPLEAGMKVVIEGAERLFPARQLMTAEMMGGAGAAAPEAKGGQGEAAAAKDGQSEKPEGAQP
ncbi:MAG: efflux RND transporter periplasmic adaptor subunit [Phycisphaeraceae bacterium]|nr:efflux RND transporter periplasmic adaptor subunit [Phycisphaeraceae bacterium]